jgi:hypothetical protein
MPPKRYGDISETKIRVAFFGRWIFIPRQFAPGKFGTDESQQDSWVIYRKEISLIDQEQSTMGQDEIYSTMLSLIPQDDLDCLDIHDTDLFRVTKRVKDITGKSATKSENRNIAVAVKKDDLFKIGEEYYFILVSKNAKSAGQSVVGGSETNQKRVIQIAVSQIVGVQTQRLRTGGANAKLSPEFNQFKFWN